ncbi:Periplasmic oligopeptide-binding protein [Baekduia alba]|uniref:ABC transporter substrate-binding protein n=1 Tax=Baekduia alba TaxID=2997333 RepID=UPI002340B2B9|nr:ABC transporter substrate-binding protein [Baekduia alba]WCB96713.1 Periplasmic oligopeptide-binding protein [Baekduia alba]
MPALLTNALRLITRTSIVVAAVLSASAGAAFGQAAPVPVGNLTMLASSDIDFLDPGHTYYTFGEMVTLATNRPLYSFKPDDALHPVPDLAADQPLISADQKTVTVTIRPGIRYAPPVNREVTSADVKYAFERFFSANVGGQYPGYFSVIKGAPSRPTRGARSISGIATPDARTIVFSLKRRSGVSFATALVMPITVPVPAEYAKPFDAHNPSTYNTHVAFTGPYMVQNTPSGSLSGYRSGKSIQLVRNPNWDAATDYRPAYLTSILIRTDAADSAASARQVAAGRDLLLDTNPPTTVLRQVRAAAPTLLSTVQSGGFRYFSLNTQVKPFNDINVRKAVMAGFDRMAARRARGGEDVGDIATHFLPPDLPGFAEAGGYDGFPDIDYFNKTNESGNRALAAKYLKKAGYKSGKYKGGRRLLLVGANTDPGKAQIEVAASQLRKLGFKVRLRLVPQDEVYTDWCQVPAKKVAMCAAGWFKDFADPQSMLEPVFKGSLISRRGGNINYSMFDDRKVDAAMDAASVTSGDERLRRWAAIDKMLIGHAAAIPFLWDKTTLLHAPNVASVPNPYVALWDLSFTSITP